MAARVIYGMARLGDLPRGAGEVDPRTATPIVATVLIVAATLVLALAFPFERLAEWTSIATLIVFAAVNASLLWLRWRRVPAQTPHFRAWSWVPLAGLVTCLGMIALALLE